MVTADRLQAASGGVRPALSRRADALIGQEMFKVLDKAQTLEAQGRRIYHMELGNPRLEAPRAALARTIEELRRENLGYTHCAGVRELREAVAGRYRAASGMPLEVENIAISPANLIINQFLDLTCNEGDRIVLFTPAFPTYWAAARHIGLEIVSIPLKLEENYELRIEHVWRAVECGPRAIVVNSANNPTGAIYDQEALSLLARLCAARGIWLLSDETYAEIVFGRPYHSLLADLAPNLVVMGSFSKIFSVPGFRTGFAIAEPAMIEKFSLSSSTLISCLPAFTQIGIAAGIHELDLYVAGVRDRFARATASCAEQINASGLLRCARPNSGFYLFVDISATGLEDMEFCDRLLMEFDTAVTPGRSFGAEHRHCVRVATCGDQAVVTEGTRRLIACAETCRH